MKTILYIDWYKKQIMPFGNLKIMCDELGYNYHTLKGKKFPIHLDWQLEVRKLDVKRGGRKKK